MSMHVFIHFRFRITDVPDGNYGVLMNETTMEFNGLVGQLQRKVKTFKVNQDPLFDKF